MNIVEIALGFESGCDPEVGDYGLLITSLIGELDIYAAGGRGDIDLIKECIDEHFDLSTVPKDKDGYVAITLRESGEQEDVFWNKYYVIEKTEVVFY